MTLVLVVDDEPNVRALLEVTLHMEGYEVVTAPDGETGLRLAAERRPDVITLDVMMPGMDGWEVAARLEGSGIPIVIMSGVPVHQLEHAPERGLAAAVMAKPFDFNDFLDVLDKAIRSGAPDVPAPRRVVDVRTADERERTRR